MNGSTKQFGRRGLLATVGAVGAVSLLGSTPAKATQDSDGNLTPHAHQPEMDNGETMVLASASMSVDAFVSTYLHRYVDVDGYYGGQCWDLWERYSRDVVGVGGISTQYSSHPGYAIGIWDGYSRNGAAPYYDQISASAVPRKGDVAIWHWGAYTHEYSHIAIVMEDRGSNVLVFEQNGYPLKSCEIQQTTKSGLAGYLRPKNSNPYGLKGAIYERWVADGGEAWYGAPTTGEITGLVDGGVFQSFNIGAIFWSPASGAHGVRGGIETAWRNLGAENGPLRYPTSGEAPIRDGGYYQSYQGGWMYWKHSIGAHYVTGGISDTWRNSGAENSPHGYPITNEMHGLKNGGVYQNFEVGAGFWSPNTGAHFVKGAIEQCWRSYGAENSWIGYPKTGERFTAAGDYEQVFEGATIRWNPSSGAWFA